MGATVVSLLSLAPHSRAPTNILVKLHTSFWLPLLISLSCVSGVRFVCLFFNLGPYGPFGPFHDREGQLDLSIGGRTTVVKLAKKAEYLESGVSFVDPSTGSDSSVRHRQV